MSKSTHLKSLSDIRDSLKDSLISSERYRLVLIHEGKLTIQTSNKIFTLKEKIAALDYAIENLK